MSILRDVRLRDIILLTLLSCVFTFTITVPGHCDDWIYVGKNDKCLYYYNNKSITIDKESNIIKVWIKYLLTDKGKEIYLNYKKKTGIDITDYDEISHIYELVIYNYNKLNNTTMLFIESSESEDVLGSGKNLDIDFDNIIPKNVSDKILIKILEDHNIKR